MAEIIVAYFHFIGIMSLFGALLAEHLLFKKTMSLTQAKSLLLTDLAYGIAAIVVLISGLLRLFYYGKGLSFYLSNPIFHAKISLFLIVAILSIYPTVNLLTWRRSLKKGIIPEIEGKIYKRVILHIRIELTLLTILPFLAVLMARGIGLLN
jgi:putative membrane protein